MSSENKRYYWLQLPEDFFNDKTVKKLRKIPGGDTYTIIALKILLLGLKNENKIYFDGVESSFAEEIALDIDEQDEAVEITLKYLIQSGWLVLESQDTIFSAKGAEMTGSETASARRMRKLRDANRQKQLSLDESQASHCDTDVTPMLRQCDGDIDIEKEIELEIDIDNSFHSLSSSAPSSESAGKSAKNQKIFINFPLLGGKSVDITEEWCNEMQSLYGHTVNVRDEIKLAIAWCNTNTKKKDWKKFLNNWFSNCLKKGGSAVPYSPAEDSSSESNYPSIELRSKEEEEARVARAKELTSQVKARWQKQQEELRKEYE